MDTRLKALIFLLLISPSIAELLSSSSPPIEFFNPISFVYLVSFYGFGALIIRWIRIKFRLDYSSILYMGFAYGVVEEGIAVKSFFNPAWPDLGILAWYGRLFGVNWIWMIGLIVYHGIVSIFIPIALTDTLFPEIKDDPLIHSRKGIAMVFIVFMFDVAIFNLLAMGNYILDIKYYILCISLIALFPIIAFKHAASPVYIPYKSLTAWIIGFTWMLLFFIIYYTLPTLISQPLITALLGIIHAYYGAKYYSYIGVDEVDRRIKVAGLLGPPSLFILFSPIVELDKTRTDNTTGMTLIGILFLIISLYLHRKIGKSVVENISSDTLIQ